MTEHDEQSALFQWAETMMPRYPELGLMFAIPNGTRTTPGVARKMKQEGTRKGVPDLFLPAPRGSFHGLFIEMKSLKGSARPEQKAWLEALACRGYCTAVCKGAEEAETLILEYLEDE